MDISVIVVSYNVRDYLSLCLDSIERALKPLSGEIIVVDNSSEDGSVDYLKNTYSNITLIANSSNVGFGKACNQALRMANGEYILFINPDTIVPEDLLSKSIQFLDKRPDAGAMGVCLIDGTGRILRESKRSIPTLWSSICKFSGLTDWFPNMAFLNGYYAPEIDYEATGQIEVLPGAFMLIRKSVLDELQGFDPRFFMYAEDIDLSYRIYKLGRRILYNGSLKAVHFKGESTKKSLVEYTDTFFTSMKLFIEKYRGELYGNFESMILSSAVNGLLTFKKYLTNIEKMVKRGKRNGDDKLLFENALLLSPRDEYIFMLQEHFLFDHLKRVSDDNSDGSELIHLRYLIPFLWGCKKCSIIMDTNSLTFSQIVMIMRNSGGGCKFWLSDFRKGFILSSSEKNRQGRSYQIES